MDSLNFSLEARIDAIVQDKVIAAMEIIKAQLKKEFADGENKKLRGVQELADFLRISYPKARELSLRKGFPKLSTGSKIPLFMSLDVMDYMRSHYTK